RRSGERPPTLRTCRSHFRSAHPGASAIEVSGRRPRDLEGPPPLAAAAGKTKPAARQAKARRPRARSRDPFGSIDEGAELEREHGRGQAAGGCPLGEALGE